MTLKKREYHFPVCAYVCVRDIYSWESTNQKQPCEYNLLIQNKRKPLNLMIFQNNTHFLSQQNQHHSPIFNAFYCPSQSNGFQPKPSPPCENKGAKPLRITICLWWTPLFWWKEKQPSPALHFWFTPSGSPAVQNSAWFRRDDETFQTGDPTQTALVQVWLRSNLSYIIVVRPASKNGPSQKKGKTQEMEKAPLQIRDFSVSVFIRLCSQEAAESSLHRPFTF